MSMANTNGWNEMLVLKNKLRQEIVYINIHIFTYRLERQSALLEKLNHLAMLPVCCAQIVRWVNIGAFAAALRKSFGEQFADQTLIND